jgi:hypothetical protein
MKIAVGSDHAGFGYKQKIKDFLGRLGHTVLDLGTDSEAPVDYPLFIRPASCSVALETVKRFWPTGSEEFAARCVGMLNRPDWLVNTTMPTCSLSVNV